MSKVCDKLTKRRAFPVKVNGETIHVRGMTRGEAKVLPGIENEGLQNVYMLGCCLVEEDGTPSFPRKDGEPVVTWLERIEPEFDGIDAATMFEIGYGIELASKPPKQETAEKK